ncbi:menin-like [Apostichopus japonicus]|uniref:menin-like n=1 Tax=Stichopus japonicus TaxID=307972 RepID=UPI003AB546E6
MATITDKARSYFPLQSVDDVVTLFRSELQESGDEVRDTQEPNLTLLSVVVGMVENILTANKPAQHGKEDHRIGITPIFPVIELPNVETLCQKFETQIKGSVDLSNYKPDFATRDLIKKVSDIVWSSLTRSFYKDRAHLQSLFSYLTGNKLDCFGVAFAVVAAFQILGYKDVHLALSEDHAWVSFGENGKETAEVTWHGKGNEDKRGQPITTGVADRSWLYLNGHPVICCRRMEVAALVSAINPSISASSDSIEVASMQQELLWMMYDLKLLKRYPLALGNLADLESVESTPGRPTTQDLFKEAIKVSVEEYDDCHVYPYTYLGGHLHRAKDYEGAMANWMAAANVVSKYNYNREDEEVYKEFMQIANDLIPSIMKAGSTVLCPQAVGFTKSSESFANFLKFYDGICKWEEESQTPVLHITWAKNFIASVTKFPAKVRGQVKVEDPEGDNGSTEDSEEGERAEAKISEEDVDSGVEDVNKNIINKTGDEKGAKRKTDGARSEGDKPRSKVSTCVSEEESLLQSELGLSGSEAQNTVLDMKSDFNDFLSSVSNGGPFPGMTIESVMKAESPAEMAFQRRLKTQLSQDDEEQEFVMPDGLFREEETVCESPPPPKVEIAFKSFKMRGIRGIVTSKEKLNTAAIHLQLTAQSQVQFSKRARATNDYEDYGSLRRRPRRL